MPRTADLREVVAPMYHPYTLVVFAPFGTDPKLGTYSGTGSDHPAERLEQHALYTALQAVARNGFNVCALIDLGPEQPTWHVWAAGGVSALEKRRAAKIVMESPFALSHLLTLARDRFGDNALVLALEGHGAGYLPYLNRDALTTDIATDGGRLGPLQWRIRDGSAHLYRAGPGRPPLGMGCPVLPAGSPFAPTNHFPLSTAGLGKALADGLRDSNQKLAVLHLNNCFNMSIEVLDTIQPYAQFATGYPNYNFFTGGWAYPAVFDRSASRLGAADLAKRFADCNQRALPEKHPTAGCRIDLSRMPAVKAHFGNLARALTQALERYPISDPLTPSDPRTDVAERIRRALRAAAVRYYDSSGNHRFQADDELIDVRSFAEAAIRAEVDEGHVKDAAMGLDAALGDLQVYGTSGTPWMLGDETGDVSGKRRPVPPVRWDFEGKRLTMNVLCPDPQLRGLWDWRSAFYLHDPGSDDPRQRAVHPHQIRFMADTGWRDFIIAYHLHLASRLRVLTIRPAAIPDYPVCRKPNQL